MTPTLEAIEKAAREATERHLEPDVGASVILDADVALELVARVRAAEAERELMARWIVDHRRYVTGARDHACGQCIPGGPIVDPSFVCAQHVAIAVQAALAAEDDATLSAPVTPVEAGCTQASVSEGRTMTCR
jgi:hypothetical protein